MSVIGEGNLMGASTNFKTSSYGEWNVRQARAYESIDKNKGEVFLKEINKPLFEVRPSKEDEPFYLVQVNEVTFIKTEPIDVVIFEKDYVDREGKDKHIKKIFKATGDFDKDCADALARLQEDKERRMAAKKAAQTTTKRK